MSQSVLSANLSEVEQVQRLRSRSSVRFALPDSHLPRALIVPQLSIALLIRSLPARGHLCSPSDVASQSSLSHWTLQQWADYYTDPNRDKVRNVISLEVSESKLGPKVIAPEVVR